MTNQFAHLHVHSEFSMLDGAAKIGPLFAEAARLGMPAVALTDHGNMFGAAEFYRASQGTGVKPILGIEAYVSPASRHHKKPVYWGQADQRGSDEFGEGGDVSGSGAYLHMTMLAENATGLRNLFRLSSRASFEGYYRKPRMDRDLISEYAQGIIATTGCPGGEVQTRLRLGQPKEAMQAASDYRDIFGDRLYLELMDHGLTIERSVRDGLLDIGRALSLPPLATNDSHYVTQDQAGAHAALLCVQTGKTLDDPMRFKFDGDGYYLKSAHEMRAYWEAEVPGAADNTLLVADRIGSYDEVFAAVDRLPRFPVPEGHTQDTWLAREVQAGLVRRFPDGLPAGYQQRADYELSVITAKGHAGYCLVVGDVVRWAKSQVIRVGPGRGSAAGSLVVYALGITELDPIRHGLLFERFLNPERPSMPDIDLDFDERRRPEVIRYVVDRWGQEFVAQIATFGTIKTKAAIKDASRVLHGHQGHGDRIIRALPRAVHAKDIPLSGVFDPQHERYGEAADLRALVKSDPQVAGIVDTARGLEGLVRNVGVHASAVILSGEPLIDVIPLWRRDDGSIVTGWEMFACEDVGLLKMDFLGLRNLTVIEDTLAGIAAGGGQAPVMEDLPLDDPLVFELLARGDTLGVFQLDSRAMRDLLIRMQPTRFEDISAALALYRPGPMAANAHHDYADRAAGRQEIRPIHPELAGPLDDILGETFHLPVYQEQILEIAQRVAGYSLGAADMLRKAMGKKKREVLDKERPAFEAGMLSNGYSPECITALWDTLVPFCDYVFGRAHTTAYGLLSYWTAYLKAHYPTEYMAALLTSVGGNKDKAAIYLAECRRLGIKVLAPDINDSGLHFAAVAGAIRFGLGAVKDVGEQVVRSITDSRVHLGRFASFEDFLGKVDAACCNKKTLAALIRAGAFDTLGHTRRALDEAHSDAVDTAIKLKRHEARGECELFADTEDQALADLVPKLPEWPRKTLLALERDVLGLSVSGHPLDGAEHVLRRHAPQPIAVLADEAPAEGGVTAAGLVTKVERRPGKHGPWAIVTVEDLDAAIEVRFFSRAYAAFAEQLVTDAVVAVQGEVSWRDDRMSIIGQEVTVLDITAVDPSPNMPANIPAPLVLRVDPQRFDQEAAVALRDTLVAHRGVVPVHVVMAYRGADVMLALDDYPVAVTEALIDELTAAASIGVVR